MIVADVVSAVSLRFTHLDATCLAMLARLQPDVLVFARCQSCRGGESADAQSLLLSRDHWPPEATSRTASSRHLFEQVITLPADPMMVL